VPLKSSPPLALFDNLRDSSLSFSALLRGLRLQAAIVVGGGLVAAAAVVLGLVRLAGVAGRWVGA
jgi:hypothetical protein